MVVIVDVVVVLVVGLIVLVDVNLVDTALIGICMVVVGGSVISSDGSVVVIVLMVDFVGVGESLTKDFVVITCDVVVGGVSIDVVMMLAFIFDSISVCSLGQS